MLDLGADFLYGLLKQAQGLNQQYPVLNVSKKKII